MYKSNTELIVIDAKATEPIPTNVVFWSHDKGTAKLAFELKKDPIPQSLAKGTIVPICLDFVGGRHIYHAVIEDALNGIVSIVLEDNILGYVGRVTGSIYIELPDKRSLDTAGRFSFEIKRSPIDEEVPELEDYYWQGFNEIMESYHQTIAGIKLEAKELLDSLKQDVSSAQEKVSQLEQSISTANTNFNARIDEISKKIDENDVFTKAESSANVIDQVSGVESAVLKKELLVNGTEGTASRYVKDIPGNNNYFTQATQVQMVVAGKVTKNPNEAPNGFKVEATDDANRSGIRLSRVLINSGDWSVSFDFRRDDTSLGSVDVDIADGPAKKFTVNGSEWTHVEYSSKATRYSEDIYHFIYLGSLTKGTYFFDNIKVEQGKNSTPYSPAPEDLGIPHGQPNLTSGISSSVATSTTLNLAWTGSISALGLKEGDLISGSIEGLNNSSTDVKVIFRAYASSGNGTENFGPEPTIKPNTQFSVKTIEGAKIPANTDTIRIYLQKLSGVGGSVDSLKIKVIKGSLLVLDEWTPSQADSGLTIINNGMVPFTDEEYSTLLSEDGVVRAETLMVGRGAEIQFDFDVIGTLERKYPYLFKGLTTIAEKIAKFKTINTNIHVTSTLRGQGLRNETFINYNMGGIYLKSSQTTAIGLLINYESSFQTLERDFADSHKGFIGNDGKYTLYAVSRKNNNSDTGAISDGVTPAWVEVKDIRLIVEVEASANEIIKSEIAAYHRENLATQEEAEIGESDEKLMTPLATKQSIEKRSVLLAGDQDVDGKKNFLVMPTVGGKEFLTTDDLPITAALWLGASFLSAAHTLRLSKNIADCASGIALKFNPYNTSSGSSYTSQTSWFIIPKHHVLGTASGQNTFCPIYRQDGTFVGAKVITVSPTKIVGADVNAVGILYEHVLTGVYEV